MHENLKVRGKLSISNWTITKANKCQTLSTEYKTNIQKYISAQNKRKALIRSRNKEAYQKQNKI